MNEIIGARFAMCRAKTLEKLYYHLFSTLGQPKAIFDHLKSDPELWLANHSSEELLDALEYCLVDPKVTYRKHRELSTIGMSLIRK